MSLIKWTPFPEPFGEMDKFLEEFGMGAKNAFMPAVDIYEKGNDLVAEIPITGIEPDKVDVSIENGILTVKGQTEKKSEVDEKNYFRKEIRSGSFYRSVTLPTAVLENKVEAKYTDGILKIIMPKAKSEKATRIKVKK